MNPIDLKNKFPVLKTDRLILRKYKKKDAHDIFDYASDPAVPIYMSWGVHKNIEHTQDFMKRFINEKYLENIPEWAIEHKESGKMIGGIGIVEINETDNRVEVGYVLNQKFWGRGIMSEALNEVLRYCFIELKVNRVEAIVRLENLASNKVLEKVGMVCEGVLRKSHKQKGEYHDVKLYSILKDEFV